MTIDEYSRLAVKPQPHFKVVLRIDFEGDVDHLIRTPIEEHFSLVSNEEITT